MKRTRDTVKFMGFFLVDKVSPQAGPQQSPHIYTFSLKPVYPDLDPGLVCVTKWRDVTSKFML